MAQGNRNEKTVSNRCAAAIIPLTDAQQHVQRTSVIASRIRITTGTQKHPPLLEQRILIYYYYFCEIHLQLQQQAEQFVSGKNILLVLICTR